MLTLVAVATIVALLALWQSADRRATRVEAWTRHVLDSLATTVQLAREELQPGLAPYRLMELRRLGLPDPERNLRDSLVAHQELIPYPGVQGGTMAFHEDAIVLMPESEQIWASFEDGHVGGTMLIEYFVEPGGRVHFKPLWSRME